MSIKKSNRPKQKAPALKTQFVCTECGHKFSQGKRCISKVRGKCPKCEGSVMTQSGYKKLKK